MKNPKETLSTDTWNPRQYQKFAKERDEPFYDLVRLIVPCKDMKVVDLGCGTGQLTKYLHDTLKAKHTLGIDSSASMLKESLSVKDSNLEFKNEKIEEYAPKGKLDLIFSNAALQWLPDHARLFERLSQYLSKTGQLAVQMPANFDYPTHAIARELGDEPAFKKELGGGLVPSVLKVEDYAQLLHRLGFKKQIVRLQVYPHVLESTEAVIEWVKGSLLTYYQSRLPPDKYAEFFKLYSEYVKNYFGEAKPFFLPFKRILIWAEY